MFLFQATNATQATQTAVETATLGVDSTKLVTDSSKLAIDLHQLASDSTIIGQGVQSFEEVLKLDKWGDLLQKLIDGSMSMGGHILKALIVFIIGRFIIRMINKLLMKVLEKRDIDISVKTFTRSLVSISLTVLLIIVVIAALGVETTSFAALLASAGVAVGMALSGNLQNFAGGLVILLFKPYKVGVWIECQGVSGTVKEIQIFHTILNTADNKLIFVPNGSLSSGVVINYTNQNIRRVEWIVGVEYGQNYDLVESVLKELVANESRIIADPAYTIALQKLDASSVNIMLRVWVNSENYWPVYFDMNQKIYKTFNERGIGFPFPQLTVHQAKN